MLGNLQTFDATVIESEGLSDLALTSSYLTAFGQNVMSVSEAAYYAKDNHKNIYYFTRDNSLNYRNSQHPLGIYDKDNRIFLAYNDYYDNRAFASISQVSLDYVTDCNISGFTNIDGAKVTIPPISRCSLNKLKGINSYLYTDVYGWDGNPSNLCLIRGTSEGTLAADAFNVDIELSDGTVLTPIWAYSGNSYEWLAIKSSTSDSSYSRGGDTDEDFIEGT